MLGCACVAIATGNRGYVLLEGGARGQVLRFVMADYSGARSARSDGVQHVDRAGVVGRSVDVQCGGQLPISRRTGVLVTHRRVEGRVAQAVFQLGHRCAGMSRQCGPGVPQVVPSQIGLAGDPSSPSNMRVR